MSELPKGWVETDIGGVFQSVKDKADPNRLTNVRYIGLEHIESNGGLLGYGDSAEVKSTKTAFRKGDVLYGKLRPYLNKHILAEFDGICSTDIVGFRSKDHVTSKFFNYFLSTTGFVQMANAESNGINLPRVPAKTIEKFPFPLPPLAEQERIVEKLDALFASLEVIKSKLDRIPGLLKTFRQQVLTQAVTGKLTEEWRHSLVSDKEFEGIDLFISWIQQNRNSLVKAKKIRKEKDLSPVKNDDTFFTIPEIWRYEKVGNLCSFINGDRGKNYPNRSEYVNDGVAFINTGHIQPNGSLDLASMNYISREKYNSLGGGKVKANDLVYCLRGATLGKTALIEQFEIGGYFGRTVPVISVVWCHSEGGVICQ